MEVNNDELHKFKHVVKTVIGVCKLSLKVSKVVEQEKAQFTPEFEQYKQSEEYLALFKSSDAKEDDDDDKKDMDPQGFDKYQEMVSNHLLTLCSCTTNLTLARLSIESLD